MLIIVDDVSSFDDVSSTLDNLIAIDMIDDMEICLR